MWKAFKYKSHRVNGNEKRPYAIAKFNSQGAICEMARGSYATEEAAQKAADKRNGK